MSVTESPLFPTFDSDTPSATQKERKERVPFRDVWAAMSREEQKAWHEAKIRQSHFRFFDEIAYVADCLNNNGVAPADRKYNVITGMPPAVGIRGVPSGVAVGRNAVKMTNARALGVAGERAVGVGAKTRIPSLTGTANYRIPDQLTSKTLMEVKNTSHLNLTRQLKDFHLYSQQTGRQFILYTRYNTTFSGPMQNMINSGNIIVRPIPFR